MSYASDDARRALLSVLDLLERHGIDHYVTGALPRNLLGSVRTTEDFDIVVDCWSHPPDAIRAIFEDAGHRVEGPLKGNLGTRFVIEPGGYETDLWLPPDLPLHRHEMANRKWVEWSGRRIPMMDPEDYVLRKVVTYKKVRRKTTDLDDAYQVLVIAWDQIDTRKLLEKAAAHRVRATMQELIQVAREDREQAERSVK